MSICDATSSEIAIPTDVLAVVWPMSQFEAELVGSDRDYSVTLHSTQKLREWDRDRSSTNNFKEMCTGHRLSYFLSSIGSSWNLDDKNAPSPSIPPRLKALLDNGWSALSLAMEEKEGFVVMNEATEDRCGMIGLPVGLEGRKDDGEDLISAGGSDDLVNMNEEMEFLEGLVNEKELPVFLPGSGDTT
jgi:hypothetical protein